jgi:hypothetical protein
MKFELDDRTVLKIGSVAAAGFGLHALAAPSHLQVRFAMQTYLPQYIAMPPHPQHILITCNVTLLQDTYFEASTPRSNVASQWFGNALLSCAATNWTVAMSDEPAPKTVKNVLKTNGIMWSIAAGQTLYNAENGWQKKDVAYTAAAGQAVIAALALWRGYADEE